MLMDDLQSLYQELIIDHYKNPRCQGTLECPDAQCALLNPLCGDEVSVQIELSADSSAGSAASSSESSSEISRVRFHGKGCSISQASASMMSELCEGKSVEDARSLVSTFTLMLKDQLDEEELVQLGDAASLQGVKKFAARIKCAMLGWEALEKCLRSTSG